MRETAQPAVVLHRRPYRETSAIVELLTRDHGRVGAIARGVRGARRGPGMCLQAFQPVLVDWDSRGELMSLRASEPSGAPFLLSGDDMLSGLYLNEICIRLLARGDPHPHLLGHYRACLEGIASGDAAWSMRRFERDLFAAIGYALPGSVDAEGMAMARSMHYRIEPDSGAHPIALAVGERTLAVSGSALLDLAADIRPADDDLRALRLVTRAWLSHYLGGKPLRSWELMRAARAQSALMRNPDR